MAVLLLRFSAPMQSWGTETKLNDHRTDPYPSKSGVVGMLSSSMGRRRDEGVDDISMLTFGVRVDKPGIIIPDFQTAAVRKNINNKMTDLASNKKYIGTRFFLSDAVFTIALEGDFSVLNDLAYNLEHPAYPLFLGRRGFPTNADLVIGVFEESIEEALFTHKYEKGMRVIIETKSGGEMVHDAPVSYDFRKRSWGYRMVKEL